MGSMATIVERVREHALTVPDRVAVRFGDQVLTFADIDRRASSVARALASAGVKRQKRIAVLAKNTPAFYDLVLGAGKADIVLVPINYRLAPPEIAFVLNDSEAELLFISEEFAPSIGKITESVPHLRATIEIDGPGKCSGQYAQWCNAFDVEDPGIDVPPDSITVQMYTSGTTGRPKGTLLSHANLREALRGGLAAWGPWHDDDVILVCMPQYHIGASIWGLGGLMQGVESVLMREFNPSEALDAIARRRVSKTQLASVMMKMMIDDPACVSTDFSSLELIIYGAAPAPLSLVELAQETFGCGIAQGYGMTETAGTITYLSPDDHAHPVAGRIKGAGRAIAGVEVRVSGPDGKSVPPGEIGEVICRGAQVARGYWKLPEASAEAICDGWLRTGDAGYLDEADYLFICDRVKDMIVSGGENIYPAEVEEAMFAHPDVSDVAVIGVPDERWGEVPMAIVVTRPGCNPSEENLLAFTRERIARYKAPRAVQFVDALPRNASGKVLKQELRRPYWQGRASAVV